MSSSSQASLRHQVPGSRPVAPPPARRRIPLASTCARPHRCPHPVRMRVLRRVGIFADLSDRQLEAIDKRMVSLSWAEGDPLFTAGEPADHLYVLAAGQVKLSRPTAAGQDVVVDLLAPGDLFGTLSTLGDPVYPDTARALSTTCVLRIDPRSFRRILTEHPQVALRVLDEVTGRLAQARSDAGQHSGSTVAQRVAATLLRLADKLGQERSGGRGTLLQVPLSRADLAGMTGSTAESVSRVMSRLRKDGVIDSGRRWTAVLDRDRLAAVAELDGAASLP